MQTQERPTVQSLETSGGIMDTLKRLVHEGNIRKVSIKQNGRVIAEFPLTLGVVGATVAPALAAIGAITALVTDCTVEVEHAQASTESSPGA